MAVVFQVLGDVIQQTRISHHLSQQALADHCGVCVSRIINLEEHAPDDSLELLIAVLKYLDIDGRLLFGQISISPSPAHLKLHKLIDSCSDDEASFLLRDAERILRAIREKNYHNI